MYVSAEISQTKRCSLLLKRLGVPLPPSPSDIFLMKPLCHFLHSSQAPLGKFLLSSRSLLSSIPFHPWLLLLNGRSGQSLGFWIPARPQQWWGEGRASAPPPQTLHCKGTVFQWGDLFSSSQGSAQRRLHQRKPIMQERSKPERQLRRRPNQA